jgi:GntR family phosphonate transport system transcriptional regulator
MEKKRRDCLAADIPIYMQICQLLEEEIQQKHKPGDLLASEQELAVRFEVNRHTIRRAISELVTKGIVGRLQGKGTIVQQKLINYSIHSNTRFTQNLESCGRQPESLVLRKVGLPAQGMIAEMLEVEENKPVIWVETLRKMDGAPFSLSSHYLPLDKVYEVMRSYKGGSLHGFLEQCYGLQLQRKVSLVSAILPDETTRDVLQIPSNLPLLQVKSVNIDKSTGVPVEVTISQFKGGITQLSIEP